MARSLLAFDFGLARIGVAVGNSITGSATPLGIIEAERKAERWAAIDALVAEWSPDAFVVGVPRFGDGQASERTALCERFSRQLGARYRRPAYLVDERFSSVVVENGREKIDHLSAAVILQQYFDEAGEA